MITGTWKQNKHILIMKKIYVVLTLALVLFAAKGYAQEAEKPLWTAEGSYVFDYFAETPQFAGTTTIEAYENNRYVIKNFMSKDGSDLEFTVSNDSVVIVTNGSGATDYNTYLYKLAGSEANDAMYVYMGAYYCPDFDGFSGDAAGGEVYLGAYYYADRSEGSYVWGTYDFVWDAATGIEAIQESKTATKAKGMYNLQGCKVADRNSLSSGMYILDGKKVLVK